jgi:hypothetical protein
VIALEDKLAKSRKSIVDVDLLLPAYSLAISLRENAFAPLSKLTTRINNSVKSSDTLDSTDDAVKTLVRKIQGTRASAKLSDEEIQKLAAEGKEVNQNSANQMDYDSRLENFFKLIKLLEQIPQYNPNEEELKVSTLMKKYDDLKQKNDAVLAATIPLSNARIARDTVLYAALTGLVDIAGDTKLYIKSLFGADSPQYKQVAKLTFKSLAV